MSRHIIRFPLAALIGAILMTMACCTHRSAAWPMLSAADSLMESRPDSALAILRSVDPSALPSGEESARYALLMSMALDKNYVDTTTFDILQPAIDYYLRKGTPDERLRTLYYQGRIYKNAHDYDKALQAFTRAIQSTPVYSDSLTMARVLYASGNTYREYYDYNNSLKSFTEAGKIYHHINRSKLEFDCQLNALNCSVILRDKSRADSLAKICQQFKPIDREAYSYLQGYLLTYYVNMRDSIELRDFIAREIDNIGYDMNDIIMLANAYYTLGQYKKALEVLESVAASGEKYDRMKYLSTAVFIYRDLGDFKNAFQSYWDFSLEDEASEINVLHQKIKLINENHRIESLAREYKRRNTLILLCSISGGVILSLLVILLLVLLRKNKIQKEKKQLEAEMLSHKIEKLKVEKDNLKLIIKNTNKIPEEVSKAIHSRIEFLNSILSKYIISRGKVDDETELLKKMTDNVNEFMNTTRLAFQSSHPRFIQHLIEHGLTVNEINYVCLYAMGLSSKDIGMFLKKPGHVNWGTTIRKKLDLSGGIYLRPFIQKLLENG